MWALTASFNADTRAKCGMGRLCSFGRNHPISGTCSACDRVGRACFLIPNLDGTQTESLRNQGKKWPLAIARQ